MVKNAPEGSGCEVFTQEFNNENRYGGLTIMANQPAFQKCMPRALNTFSKEHRQGG